MGDTIGHVHAWELLFCRQGIEMQCFNSWQLWLILSSQNLMAQQSRSKCHGTCTVHLSMAKHHAHRKLASSDKADANLRKAFSVICAADVKELAQFYLDQRFASNHK